MSYGKGKGPQWDGQALVATSDPRADVDEPFTAYDFEDQGNGTPFPGPWNFFVQSSVPPAGTIEPTPDLYFTVLNGYGRFIYTVVGPEEHGFAAGPVGVLTTRNSEVALIVRAPTVLLDPSADEFVYEVTVGARTSDDGASYAGVRMRAAWAAGAWTDALVLEAIRVVDGVVTVLATADIEDMNDPLSVWEQARAELALVLRGDQLTGTLYGWRQVAATIPAAGTAKPIILVKVYNKTGGVLTSPPVIAALHARSLRDPALLGPPPLIEGDLNAENPPFSSTTTLPMNDLVAKGFFARRGGREWVAKEPVEVDFTGVRYAFNTGDIVRAVEPFHGQDFVRVTFDLATLRAARGRAV